MKILRGFLLALSCLALCTFFVACSDPGVVAHSDSVPVYQLKTPGNLQAVPRNGFVYLTWDPVPEAREYAVYRSLPTQAGVNSDSDTAFSLIGIVGAATRPTSTLPRAATVGEAVRMWIM